MTEEQVPVLDKEFLIDINGFTTLYTFFDWAVNCAETLDDDKMEGYDDVGLYLCNGWEDCIKEKQTIPTTYIGFVKRWWRKLDHKSDSSLYINTEEGMYVGKSIGGDNLNIEYDGCRPAVLNRIGTKEVYFLDKVSDQEKQVFFDFVIVAWDQLRRAQYFSEDDTPNMMEKYPIAKYLFLDLHEIGFRSKLYDWVLKEEDLERDDSNWFFNYIKETD